MRSFDYNRVKRKGTLLPHGRWSIDGDDFVGRRRHRYSEDDVGWIEFLERLRSTGMPITEMQRYVELQQEGAANL